MRSAWRTWLGNFDQSLEQLGVSTIDVGGFEDAERRSVALALFARLRAELRAALTLADAGHDMAFRSYCRSAIECALHLYHGEVNASYLEQLHTDDTVSRRSRAKTFLKNAPGGLPADARQSLEKFLQDSSKAKGKLLVSEIETPFPRLNHVYREISADAAHVTWTSLHRQLNQNKPGWTTVQIDAQVSTDEMEEAASILAFAGLVVVRSLLQIVPELKEQYDLEAMFRTYKPVYQAGRTRAE
ncbi:hypothetical protein [Mesorhizobium sp. B2-3-4]|uniref:hypothetical protein n=1 Tax=Mesorhizobium sp. B2-3-4 TaxID=2589959 RepID=UPI001129374C|nr:hypothetical protein [Mesorhizobium sp. B2-3-4]TPM34681.1 hypothetical protein FJ967_21885 [Mesorhizobium sp. B2-3-4]